MSTHSPHGLGGSRPAFGVVFRSALCLGLGVAPACAVYQPGLTGAELDDNGGAASGGLGPSAGANNASAGKANPSGGSVSGGTGNVNGQAGAAPNAGASAGGASAAGASAGGASSSGAANAAGAGVGGASGGAPNAGAPGAGAPAGGSAAAGAPAGGAPGLNPCDKANWKVTASSSSLNMNPIQLYNPPEQAIDGLATSRWSSGVPQSAADWFLLNLGAQATHLTQLVLDTSKSPTDFPVAYAVELSSNGTAYTQVATGAGAAITTVNFADTPAQYIRVKQTGTGTSWWSIQELTLTCQQ